MTDGFSKHWLASKMTSKHKMFETSYEMIEKENSIDNDLNTKKK